MAGIGDSWGTAEELLHPRGPDGRWIRKGGMARSVLQSVMDFLGNFRPRTFQSRSQASQYLHNVAQSRGVRRMGRADQVRLSADLSPANADLRDGVIDEPSTKRFVEMMDRSMVELPDDTILTRIVGVDAFGFTPETAKGSDRDNPGIRGVAGKLVADRAYGLTTIGGPEGPAPAGSVRMVIAAKKGTRAVVPAASGNDNTVILDRGQPLRVTKVTPDGAGGWTMYVTADSAPGGRDIPAPVGGPVGVRQPSKDREARIRRSQQELARLDEVPDEEAEAEAERARAEERAKMGAPVPSPAQEAERRRIEQMEQAPQQPAPGEPAPRTEPAVGRVGEAPAAGTVPAAPETGAPQPTAPRRVVDIRTAVRDAGISSPSRGKQLQEWNEAYLGLKSGKLEPDEAARNLDANIRHNRGLAEDLRGREGNEVQVADLDENIKAQEQLRDLIRREYGLGETQAPEKRTAAGLPKAERPEPVKTKLSKREQEAETRNVEAAKKAAPAPTPAKKAPAAKKAVPAGSMTEAQERAVIDRAKQFRGKERNAEETRIVRQADEILARRRGETAPGAAPAKKVAKAPAAKKTLPPVAKKAPAKAAPVKKAAPEVPGDDLDKMAKAELLALARREGVGHIKPISSMNKDQLKTEIRRLREIGPIEPGSIMGKENRVQEIMGLDKKPTVAQLRAFAKERGLTVGSRDSRVRLMDTILAPSPRERADVVAGPGVIDRMADDSTPAKKAVRGPLGVPNSDTVRQTLVDMPADDRFPYLEDLLTPLNLTQSRRVAKDLGVRSAGRSEKPQIIAKIIQHFEGAGDIEAVARLEGPPAPVKKAAKKVAPRGIEADRGRIPLGQSETAPEFDTKNLKIGKGVSATRIRAGDVVWVEPGKLADGTPSFLRTRKKTGSLPLTVTRNERESGNNYILHGTLPDGREVTTAGYFGQNTFYRVDGLPEGGMPAPAKTAAKAVPEGPSGHPGDTGMARALIPEQQERQVKLDRVRAYGTVGTEIDELVTNGTSPKALAHRIRTRGKQQFIPDEDVAPLIRAAEAGDNDRVRDLARKLMEREGVTQIGSTDEIVPKDSRDHQSLTGTGLPTDVSVVRVVRPGSRAKVDGDDVLIDRAVVEPASPEEVQAFQRARQLVPEGSTEGTRTQAPVDNAPRKRELRKAILDADLPPASPGSARKAQQEIRDDLVAGRITPEEAIRRHESEVEFLTEDANEVDANLRQTDLTDAERSKLMRQRELLQASVESNKKHSEFLRQYFKDEGPVTSIDEMKEVDPVSYEFLKDATPDDMREAAKEAGLDPPSGDTPDEMFTDLLKQVARNELARRAAKKAAKKAAPAKVAKKAAPAVPKERERIDARLVGAGIDFDENDKWVKRVLDDTQKDLDSGDKTPAAIGRELDDAATRRMTTAVYEHGAWHAESSVLTPAEKAQIKAENQAEYDRVKAETTKIRELGARLQKTRRKPVKKAAPEAPKEIRTRDEQIDDLQKRIIDNALVEIQGAKSRDKADDALEGLTLPELRRLADQSGIENARTKRKLRDNILDRFVGPEQGPDIDAILTRLNSFDDPPSREDAAAMVAPLNKAQLQDLAARASIPGARSKSMIALRREIVEGTAGARLDSIATRGFRGARPGLGDVQGRPDLPTVSAPRAPATDKGTLSRRARDAGIPTPAGQLFEGTGPGVDEADRRLRAGESPTEVARFLRARATEVSRGNLDEEERRHTTRMDKDTLRSIRKQSAEYLRRVATHVQQEGKATKATPAKKAAPRASAPEVDAQIQTVYQDLADRPGAWVPLADVRERLSGMDRTDVDAALERLAVQPGIHVIPWDNRKALTDRDRAASVRIGGDDAHAIRIEAPAKKAAPRPDLGEQVKILARGTTRAEREGTDLPSPSRTGTSPVGGTKSTAPEIPNNWGMLGTGGEVEFHDDGVIGQRLRQMGDDRLMDVDGEPLSNVIGKLATRAVRGQISQEQLLMDLDRLYKRLPAGSRAKGQVKSMMEDLDAPARAMPDLPEGTPAPFRTAMERLLQIPVARDAVDRPGFHRSREDSEVDKLLKLMEEFQEGRTGGLRMINEIQDMRRGLPHESQEGRFEADRVLRQLHDDLEALYRDKDTRSQVMPKAPGSTTPPPAKKATPRLTAIPGEGTGGGRKKRPNLRVVRNEDGELTIIWDEGDDHVQLPKREQQPSDVYAGSTV